MRTAPTLVLAVLTAACARDGAAYPSLAQRPTELRGFAEPDAPPPPEPLRADPALDAQVAGLAARLAAAADGFERDATRTEAAAARSGARTVGSEAWLDAQSLLATLDDWRAQSTAVAADAAEAASARAAALAPTYPALDRVQAAAAAQVERQDMRIRAIAARLPAA